MKDLRAMRATHSFTDDCVTRGIAGAFGSPPSATAPNLAAVFCGHVHVAHAGAINTRARYVGGPGFAGGRPPVELRPL